MASTGRNESCPCGSGKKHKKCCLNRPAKDDFSVVATFEGPSQDGSGGPPEEWERWKATVPFSFESREHAESTVEQMTNDFLQEGHDVSRLVFLITSRSKRMITAIPADPEMPREAIDARVQAVLRGEFNGDERMTSAETM